MDDDQFQIEFIYNGQEYAGLVTPATRDETDSFVVQYTLAMSRQFEKTVEICKSENTGSSDSTNWTERPDEEGQLPTTHALVQIIGQAIEDYE